MMYHVYALIFILTFSILLLILLLLGRRIGLRQIHTDTKGAKAGITQVEGAVYALLGLMIAFTFYGAGQRFDMRREMIVNETNSIGTAWLRIALLPESLQPKMYDLFRQYTDARLGASQKLPDIEASKQQMLLADKLQNKIWAIAIEATKLSSASIPAIVVIPALNNMFDIATTHNIAIRTHPPFIIFVTLIVLIGFCCFFLGYSTASSKHINWLHGISFVFIMSSIFYVIIDFEFPRIGIIHLGDFDLPMIELRDKM